MSILDSFENTFNGDNVFFLKRRMFEQMLRFTVTEEYNRRKTAHTSNHTFIATYVLSPHVIYDDLVRRYFYPEYGFKFGSFTWSTKPCWKEHASNAKVSRIKALFSLDDNDIALLIDNERLFNALQKELARLSNPEQILFDLRFTDELSIKEIAVILEKTESTVKTNLRRGKQILKNRLEKLGYER